MSSTNKTTNYNLSQFLGSDKPAWLADYNQDMNKIDAQMKLNADASTGADGKADANTANIGDLTYLSTSAKNNLVAAINEVDGNTDSAYNLASTASTSANTANTKISALESKFNFTSFETYTATFSGSGTLNNERKTLTVAKNSDGSLCKIYGNIQINNPSYVSSVKITGTGLAPSSDITIKCAGILRLLTNGTGGSSNTEDYIIPADLTIKTNGDVEITPVSNNSYYNSGMMSYIFHPVIIFVKDFGDTPSPEQ